MAVDKDTMVVVPLMVLHIASDIIYNYAEVFGINQGKTEEQAATDAKAYVKWLDDIIDEAEKNKITG